MSRRKLREHLFKLIFLSEFNSAEEMPEQTRLYLGSQEELTEDERAFLQERFESLEPHISEIDEKLNSTSKGWKTGRMLSYSPIKGPEGNIEYLLFLSKQPPEGNPVTEEMIAETVRNAHGELDR